MKSAGSYRFQYRHGQSAPYATLQATDDNDFFKNVLPAWESEKHFQHIEGTVICTVSETRKVPEPPRVSTAENYDSDALRAAGERLLPASVEVARKVVERFGRQT